MNKKLDRRRKYYMILDCETATLPCASSYEGKARQRVSIAKPLIYDFGYNIIDQSGKIYRRRSFLVSEIFSVPSVFNTAYYAQKRPQYLQKLRDGEIELKDWNSIAAIFENDLQEVSAVGAYNSMFDFKKAIPFTELYISKLYSDDFFKWEAYQKKLCDRIAENFTPENERDFEGDVFRFRSHSYPLFDVWGLCCEHILNSDDFREQCHREGWYSESGKYFKTSAEVAYRFIKQNSDFIESHTAIEDADIESEIFSIVARKLKNKIPIGIIYFPFRLVGRVY